MRLGTSMILVLLLALACSEGGIGGGGGGEMKVEHLVEGKGLQPRPQDAVEVHYHGTLEDGTVFDSSVSRGEPAKFPLNRVIACWQMGIPQMKVGGKAKLTCPPDVAYGPRGTGRIPPNATLTFEVELLGVY